MLSLVLTFFLLRKLSCFDLESNKTIWCLLSIDYFIIQILVYLISAFTLATVIQQDDKKNLQVKLVVAPGGFLL